MIVEEIIKNKIRFNHRGKDDAIKRENLLRWWNWNPFFSRYWGRMTDRELRRIYAELPIVACNEGLYWPIKKEELLEFKDYLKKKRNYQQ